MYHIIICILTYLSNLGDTCAKLSIPYEKQDGRNHCSIERETAVAMETIDHLSTYIYADNYQNNVYGKEIMILLQIEFLPIYGKSLICNWRVYTATYRQCDSHS